MAAQLCDKNGAGWVNYEKLTRGLAHLTGAPKLHVSREEFDFLTALYAPAPARAGRKAAVGRGRLDAAAFSAMVSDARARASAQAGRWHGLSLNTRPRSFPDTVSAT